MDEWVNKLPQQINGENDLPLYMPPVSYLPLRLAEPTSIHPHSSIKVIVPGF